MDLYYCEEIPWPWQLSLGKLLTEMAVYSLRGSVPYHRGREHESWQYSSMEADMVLEQVLRILIS